jgi:hypothetical protein
MSASIPPCDAVLVALGARPLSPELQAHLATCPRCQSTQATHATLARLRPGARPRPQALLSAHALARAELRAHPGAQRWWWSVLGLVGLNLAVGLGSAVVLLMHGPGLHGHPAPSSLRWAVALLLLVLLAAGPLLAFAPSRRGALGAGLLLALTAAGAVGFAGSGSAGGRLLATAWMSCASAEVLLSLLPLATTLWLLTRLPARPLRTLLAGLSAATVGLLGLHLSCPVGTVTHLLGAHVLPWLALAGLALILRPRLPTRAHAP